MNTIKKNFIYNALYNILSLIVPLITIPYISRKLGAKSIGIYSYTYTIASYFSVFILLGLANYGNRVIATNREDINNRSKNFWNIYVMQLFMMICTILVYLLYVLIFSSHKKYAFAQVLYLFSVGLDISWFYFGLEKFKLIVVRSTIIKLLNLCLIILFVSSSNDLFKYVIIMVMSTCISQIWLWVPLNKFVKWYRPTIEEIKAHIKPNLILFLPVIAVSIYTMMDKIMLGQMSSMKELGFYENSYKLIQIPSVGVTALGTVMLPRISNLLKNNKEDIIDAYLRKSVFFTIVLSATISFGLSAIVDNFVPVFFGDGYNKCIYLIPLLLFASIFMSFANVIRTQYLIPFNKDIVFLKSSVLGAFINFFANMFLIYYFESVGAAIGTILAELSVCLYQIFKVKKYISINSSLIEATYYIISGVVMYVVVKMLPFFLNNYITMFIKIITGIGVYVVTCFIIIKVRKMSLKEYRNRLKNI